MAPDTRAFSQSYAEARTQFLTAARQAGASITSYNHPKVGRDGEALAMDVACLGAPDAARMLMVSSACHGVEGYCGSGVQTAALRDAAWLKNATDSGVAVLFIHAVNPYGFSHIRRVTHENVDLNRNFQNFSAALPDSSAYAEVHELLLPDVWPPEASNTAAIQNFIATRGIKALQAAVSGGQYAYPHGLFFGGTEATWSNTTLREILRSHAGHAEHLGWIDLHTGLGPSGHGERGFAGRSNDGTALARARQWWEGGGKTPLVSLDDGSSVSAPLVGLMWGAVYDECPHAQTTAMAIEFGTQPLMQVLQALRAEQWLQLHPQAAPALATQIKRDLRDAFYVDTEEWKEAILAQSFEAMDQALGGLASAALTAT